MIGPIKKPRASIPMITSGFPTFRTASVSASHVSQTSLGSWNTGMMSLNNIPGRGKSGAYLQPLLVSLIALQPPFYCKSEPKHAKSEKTKKERIWKWKFTKNLKVGKKTEKFTVQRAASKEHRFWLQIKSSRLPFYAQYGMPRTMLRRAGLIFEHFKKN